MVLALPLVGCAGGAAAPRSVAPPETASAPTLPGRSAESAVGGAATIPPVPSPVVPGAPSTTAANRVAPPGGGTTSTSKPLDLRARLASGCVVAGSTQTITIETEPEAFVGYSSEYADGKTGFDPGYYGGQGNGRAGVDGRYSDTWRLAATAPPGEVRVTAIAGKGGRGVGQVTATFIVAAAGSRCP